MRDKMTKVESLAKLHRQTTGAEIDLQTLQSKWEDMTVLLASYDQVAKEQMEQLKQSTKERANQAKAKVDKLKSKWQQGKPTDERGLMSRPKEMKQFSDFVAEKHAEMLELSTELAEIDQQLIVFGLEPLDIKILTNLFRTQGSMPTICKPVTIVRVYGKRERRTAVFNFFHCSLQ